jgi:peptidoglycan/LPS O-acetylase OafA/YrhL
VKKFPAFDGLRAFAAIGVVVVHTAFYAGLPYRSSLATYTARAEIGVSVFFVISGFLLYRPFVVARLSGRSTPDAAKFWVRRFFRIVPAYWLALTVAVYVLHVGTVPAGWPGALSHYLFLQIYFSSQVFTGLGPSWSLCVEVSFYLFLPLYAMVVAARSATPHPQLRREVVGLLLLTATSFVFRAWIFTRHVPCGTRCLTHPPITSAMASWLPAYLDLFAIGMLLAVLSAWFSVHGREPEWLAHRAMPWICWALAVGAYVAVSHLGIKPLPVYVASAQVEILRQTLYGIFALLLVAPAVFGPQEEGAIRRLLRWSPVAWVGVVSYGVYLWHAAVIQEFFNWTSARELAVPFWILFLSVLAGSVVVATISYLALEQPLLEYASRITRRKKTAPEREHLPSGADARPDVSDGTVAVVSPRHAGKADVVAALAHGAQSWRASLGPRWFLPGLGAIVALAAAIRVAFAARWTFGRPLPGDASFFHGTAASIAGGRGYSFASLVPPHHLVPTAQHPPLFPTVLAAFDILGLHSMDAQRIALGVVASAAVFLTGLVGHRVGGPLVGLVAAGIAAADPLWFQPSAALMSESVYLIIIATVLLVALRSLERPTRWRFVVLGAAVGLAALTRSDALGLSVILGVPLVLSAVRTARARLGLARCILAGLALVLAPWLIRNEIQMGGLALSDNQGGTLAGSYCPQALDPGNFNYGGFDGFCADAGAAYLVREAPPPNHARSWTELSVSNALWSATQPVIRRNLGALPGVVVARVENTLGLARTNQQVYLGALEGAVHSFERFGLELGRVLLVAELLGAIVLFRRSRARCAVVLAPVVAVAVNSAIFYGSTRFLAMAEPSLAVFAALGAGAVVAWLRRRVPPKRASREGDEPNVVVALVGADSSRSPAAPFPARSQAMD